MAVDPKANKQASWSTYKSFYDNPLVYNDPDGQDEYLKVVYTDESTGIKVTKTYLINKDVIRTDGIVHKIPSSVGDGEHYENNYYDYEVTLNINIDKSGKQTETATGRYMYENGPKDSDNIWSKGAKAGTAKTDWGSKLDIRNYTGNAKCEGCGDNSKITKNGGIVFGGNNPVKDGIDEAIREYVSKHTEQVDGDIVSLVGGMPGNSPGNLYDKGKNIADAINQLSEAIDKVNAMIPTRPEKKTYPTQDEYTEPSHDGGSGGEYINKDESLYRHSTYNSDGKRVSQDTIDTSKKKWDSNK